MMSIDENRKWMEMELIPSDILSVTSLWPLFISLQTLQVDHRNDHRNHTWIASMSPEKNCKNACQAKRAKCLFFEISRCQAMCFFVMKVVFWKDSDQQVLSVEPFCLTLDPVFGSLLEHGTRHSQSSDASRCVARQRNTGNGPWQSGVV